MIRYKDEDGKWAWKDEEPKKEKVVEKKQPKKPKKQKKSKK